MARFYKRSVMTAIFCATTLIYAQSSKCFAQYLENIGRCSGIIKDKVEILHSAEMDRLEKQSKADISKFISERNDEVKRYLKQQNSVYDQCRIAIRDLQIHGDPLDKDSYERSINVTLNELKALKREPFKRPTAEENLTNEERIYRNLRADGRSDEDAKNLSGLGAVLAATKFISQNKDLENLYYSHRSISTPPALTFGERCLRGVLLKNNPNYAFSEEHKILTSTMDDERVKSELQISLSTCPKEAKSLEFIDQVAKNISYKLGDEWNKSAVDAKTTRNRLAVAKDLEWRDKFKPSATTKAGFMQLACPANWSMTEDRQIGKMPRIPSTAEIAQGFASGYVPDDSNDGLISKALKRRAEFAGSKAAFNAQIANARLEFFNITPGSTDQARSGELFGNLLFLKDIYYLGLYIPEGTGMSAQSRANAINVLTGGASVDNGLSLEARSDFDDWVEAVRRAMHAPAPGQLWLPDPTLYSQALSSTMNVYARYKKKRDQAEYYNWKMTHEPKPVVTQSVSEKVDLYFKYNFDPAINQKYCESDQIERREMDEDREYIRSALFYWENFEITPEIVLSDLLIPDFKLNPNSATLALDEKRAKETLEAKKVLFSEALERAKRSGISDKKLLTLKAMQEVYDGGPNARSPQNLAIVESKLRIRLLRNAGVKDFEDSIIKKYDLRVPEYESVAHHLAAGRYR